MAQPARKGKYLGETVVHDGTVWIWMGSSWDDAGVRRPEHSGDVAPLDENES